MKNEYECGPLAVKTRKVVHREEAYTVNVELLKWEGFSVDKRGRKRRNGIEFFTVKNITLAE